jgi:hypothetical protein
VQCGVGSRRGSILPPEHSLGRLTITRAGHVEPDARGGWLADLSPVGGPALGPFSRRSEALAAEQLWLEKCLLGGERI